jgi:hypothetical protein
MMNEFTKEELNDLWCGLGWLIEARAYHKLTPLYDLRHKIQSLIDNYCEHLNDEHFNALPKLGGIKMCKKCQGFYE